MQLRQYAGTALVDAIAQALAGGAPVAPVCDPRVAPALGLDQPVTEPDAALVVPTSGTTSAPKAVVLSASAIRFAAQATHARLGGPGDWVCALPTQHVAGLMTIARAVVAGTRLSFARSDLADLPTATTRSYLSLVGAQLHQALSDPRHVARLATYQAILVGGSAIEADLLDRAREAGLSVVTTYGASETCGGCVYDGLPLEGVGVQLVDERILLQGPMVFSGYRLQPALTAQVLHGDVVTTADRGRLVDGRLQVLGRIDDVIISGGEKVDLAWAQQVCDQAFGGAAAGGPVLLALPDPRWGRRVVAVTTSDVTLEQVRERVGATLGRAAVPKELRQVPSMAYTSLGKIDRAALLRAWQEGVHGNVG
jgi:O-succinylbenzoic acid--CoA ligase